MATLPAFLAAVVLISASPGPAMALIFRRAALHGLRSTVPTVLGLEAVNIPHTVRPPRAGVSVW